MKIKDYLEQSGSTWIGSSIRSCQRRHAAHHTPRKHEVQSHGGGKRVRPIPTIAAAEAVGEPAPGWMPVACSLELIHTYSDSRRPARDGQRRLGAGNRQITKCGERDGDLAGDASVDDGVRSLQPSGLDEAATWHAKCG